MEYRGSVAWVGLTGEDGDNHYLPMSEELQQRTESLRQMVETRDLIIKDLEREIRELKAMLHGTTL